ncbi:hypothetical protein LB570_30155, partial [Mesorhizobium sp. BR1-1-5]|nr:hypothetical protein [Mesorhizobium sp. BR1-1-5]
MADQAVGNSADGKQSNHAWVEDLTDIDGWQSRLIVGSSFDQYTGTGHGGEDGEGRERNAESRALLWSLHGMGEIVKRGFHQRMLIEDRPT